MLVVTLAALGTVISEVELLGYGNELSAHADEKTFVI
jgi:hypothetical protein